MHVTDHLRENNIAAMHAQMRARPFAMLVSAGSLDLYATHLPTVLKDEGEHGVVVVTSSFGQCR